jgi:DNA-directed RNA polymerase specialized sigma24 family protein
MMVHSTEITDDQLPADDCTLLTQIAAGDQAAFETFCTRFTPLLVAYLQQLVPDYGLVEEILQDTWLALW